MPFRDVNKFGPEWITTTAYTTRSKALVSNAIDISCTNEEYGYVR